MTERCLQVGFARVEIILRKKLMIRTQKLVYIIVLTFYFLCAQPVVAQADRAYLWTKFTEIATNARKNNDYGLAEKMFQEALERAESFGEKDSRLTKSLINLSNVYYRQKKLTAAEPLYQRLIELSRKVPEHSTEVISSLHQYTELLRLANRNDSADSIVKLTAEMATKYSEFIFSSDNKIESN